MKTLNAPFTNIIGLIYFGLGLSEAICLSFAPQVVFIPALESIILMIVGAVFLFGLSDEFLKVAFDKIKARFGIATDPAKKLTVDSPYTNWMGALLSLFAILQFVARAYWPDLIHTGNVQAAGFGLAGAFVLFGMSDDFFTAIFQAFQKLKFRR